MAIAKPPVRRATGSSRLPRPRRWGWAAIILLLALGGTGWYYRGSISGYSAAAASYSAHVTCSCRYIEGRSLHDCKKDRLAGMELISLKDDVEAQSVTARFPLMPSQTATFRKGYGCLLQKWDG